MSAITPPGRRILQTVPKSAKSRAKIVFDAFVSGIYLPYMRTRKRSWEVDERIARQHISPVFGAHKLADIRPFEVEQWLGALRESGLAAATCNRILAVFKAICSLAEKSGLIEYGSSPARAVRLFRVLPAHERFLDGKEARRLMARLAASPSAAARVVELLILTGARKSEILNARWENINLKDRILTVPLSKGGTPRHIILSLEAARLIGNIERRHGSPWLFPGRDPEKPLSDIYHYWKMLRNCLDLGDVRLHDLRHTFASFLVNSGRTLYETQCLLGHADPRTTMRYAHLAQEALREAVDELAARVREGRRERKRNGRPRRISPDLQYARNFAQNRS